MKEKRFTFESADGISLFAIQWSPSGMIRNRGVIQIIHGMAEHKERYRAVAEFLTGEGFSVYIHDVRGHGESAGSIENQGFFAEEDGWMKAVDDARLLSETAKAENSGLPFFLLGHSMGSLLARTYVIRYNDPFSGLILSGTSAGKGILEDVGLAIAAIQRAVKGSRHPSGIHHKLVFGNNNKPFEPGRTPFDWLTRDERIVDAYIADPYCGAVFTTTFYRDLITGVKYISKPENIARMSNKMPVYLISGERDLVGDNGKGVRKVADAIIAAGNTDVTVRLYPDTRHEIFNELNREDICRDLLEWMKARL